MEYRALFALLSKISMKGVHFDRLSIRKQGWT